MAFHHAPAHGAHAGSSGPPTLAAWIAFALIFGLMLSDYLSRQVINAVFPFIKAQWSLSDTQLGSLVSIVAVTVGVFSFPVSVLADRFGRVLCVTIMAVLWGLATLLCGLAGSFTILLFARLLVGLGEAGYSSAGGAILLGAFPARLHATVMGAFLAASLFGSVLGVVLGGVLAASYGWRTAFVVVGAGGLLLALVFPLFVKERPDLTREAAARAREEAIALRDLPREILSARTAAWSYLGSGLQMFSVGAMLAWIPSFLNRHHGMPPAEAALAAGVLTLLAGIGMVLGGVLVDVVARRAARNRPLVVACYAFLSCVLFVLAFRYCTGTLQLLVIGAGMFLAGAHAGPTGAIATSVTSPRLHATVLATGTLANNIFGLAPGPVVTGLLADRFDLQTALGLVPLPSLLAAACFVMARRHHDRDVARIADAHPSSSIEALEEIA
ncbi:MAG TPA: MFS transporter [Pseudomonadales bacterium]|jgi:MFS family permease|nr:MFS transporter [Pseudomonadales bacterium]